MKKGALLIVLIFLPGFMGDYQNKTEKLELDAFHSQVAMEQQNKVLIQKLIGGLNNRDTSMYAEIYAPNCVYYFPSASANPGTREQDLQSTKTNWQAFPDIHWNIEETIADSNMVAVWYTASGTQQEQWFGVPSEGKRFEADGIFAVRIENGKIVEQREDFDLLGALQQLWVWS